MPGARRWDGWNLPQLVAGIAAVVAVGLVAAHLWMAPLPGLARLERYSVDARFRLRGPRPAATDQVVIVGVDDRTRIEAPEVAQTRAGWARLITALAKQRPAVIAIDAFFADAEVVLPDEVVAEVAAARVALAAEPAPSPGAAAAAGALDAVAAQLDGDDELAAAIRAAGNVVLGANFHLGRGAAAPAPAGLRLGRHGEVVAGGVADERAAPRATGVTVSLPTVAAGAAGTGAVNLLRDDDQLVRHVPLAIELPPHHYMTLGVAAVAVAQGTPGGTRYRGPAAELVIGERRVALGRAASLALDVPGSAALPRVSAAALLADEVPPGLLTGKVVFVGLTYAAYDKITTPLDSAEDGVAAHAIVAENLLGGRLLREAGAGAAMAATVIMLGVLVLAQHRRVRRRAWLPPLLALLLGLAWLVAGQLAFSRGALILPLAAPLVATFGVALVALLAALATEGREKRQLRTAFSRYVSGAVVERILADPALAELGGRRRELTVLFSDIRGFSGFSETMPPEQLAALLGEYLTPMTELVLAEDGMLDKYIGDALMAVWGAPVDAPDYAARGCAAALAMQARLVELNRAWAGTGRPHLAIGIGISTGPMVVGNMGSRARFDYTVLGDAVNLGARLEGLTREYGVDILCSDVTAAACRDRFAFRELGRVRVKGRAGAAPVYELLGPIGAPLAVDVDAWHAALATYHARDFAAAAAAFRGLATAGDPAAAVLAERAEALAAAPPGDAWDGVYQQRHK